jgi:hypothetical protein
MDIFLTVFLWFFSAAAPAVPDTDCNLYVIGFRGAGGVFDQAAFDQYAERKSACSQVYNWRESAAAVEFVQQVNQPYELYGFSAGAVAVKQVLTQATVKPVYAITVGAYHSVDVNFDRFGIPYDNWFDASGRGQRSPGHHHYKISHDKIQQHVNQYYR